MLVECAGLVRGLRSRAEETMDLGIKGLRVIVTAAAAGIGREVARAFVHEGARVHICDVDRTALPPSRKATPS